MVLSKTQSGLWHSYPDQKQAETIRSSRASGKVGLVIIKQYKHKTVYSKLPDMSKRKLSPLQILNNKDLARAQRIARTVNNDPALKERYTRMHDESPRKFRGLFNFVVSHHLQLQKEERLRRVREARGGVREEIGHLSRSRLRPLRKNQKSTNHHFLK